MAFVSADEIRARLADVNARREHYEKLSASQASRLKRHEVWRHAYLADPYLLGAPDDRVAKRFCEIFMNTTELGPDGKIGTHDIAKGDAWMQKFTHMLEEYGSRNGTPADVIAAARKPVVRYFENGDPIALKLFAGYQAPPPPFIVKYGKRQFLEPMLAEGRIRICPASFYNNASFLPSVQDDEISRTFFIPTYKERIAGKDAIDFQGHRIVFGNDDIVMPVVTNDYFLFSLCDQIYYRLPTDFDADAALIIRDPILFTQRVISAFLAQYPDWQPLHGPVTYYDPYRDYTKITVPEMTKHFGYWYQREVRIAFKATRPIKTALKPVFLKIGPLKDFADLIWV